MKISESKLDLDLFENYINEETSELLKRHIIENTGLQIKQNMRSSLVFGEIKSYYLPYYGIEKKVLPWDPIIKDISDNLESLTGQKYHVCVIQYYPNGNVGINPHRDKEMSPNTIITSLSLGSTRNMQFSHQNKEINVELKQGSILLINPPTNNVWKHSISKDSSAEPRISLIFRNCENMF